MDCVHLLRVIYALILRKRSHWSAGSLRLISDGPQSGVADEEALEMASTAKVRWAALQASLSLSLSSLSLISLSPLSLSLSLFACSLRVVMEGGRDWVRKGRREAHHLWTSPSAELPVTPSVTLCPPSPAPPSPPPPLIPLGQAIQPLTDPALDKDQELSGAQTLTL